MDSPLPPPPVSSITTTTTINPTNPNISHLGYPDSVDSSPRSRNTNSWDEPLPSIPGGAKLRLMCSYGGHIVPRPHDKSLCYLGGDTRIIVVDRHSSLSDLSLRLSRSLLNGRSFTLKYQLPNEDLDSLISVTTDEDLDNMIEEYDRTSSASSLKPSRIRLFLFVSKPETASSMGSLLEDSKSESWFVDALNGSGNLPRGLSADAASVNCLLGLDEIVHVNKVSTDVEAQNDSLGNINKHVKHVQDVQSVPDSPMVETSSSFGSTSSSPSMSNLPPIRVHVEDQKSGFEEQFAHMNIAAANAAAAQKQQDEGFVALSSPPPPLPTTIISGMTSNSSSSAAAAAAAAAAVNENQNRVYSDDERSDYGVPTGFRKPPQPPQPQQLQQKTSGVDLQSPDEVGRDISRSKPMYYQEQIFQQVVSRVSANPVDPKRDGSDPSYRITIQPGQDSGYVLSSQLDQQQQQQFIHGGTHYIQHHPSGQVPMSSYYPVYLNQQQQQQQQQQQLQQQQQHQQQHQQQQLDQQYHPSMYFLPVHQTQPYNVAIQSNLNETAKITSTRPPTAPTSTMISNAVSYKEPGNSPVYPPRSAPPTKPEITQSVYKTAAPHLIHTPSDQHQQQQYMSYHQMHHQSQSIAAAPANYGYEYTDPSQAQLYSDQSHGQVYSDPSHAQIYYTQPLGSILPTQYQTMNAAQAVAAVSEASAQLPTDSMKQQQLKTAQPL